MKEIAARRPTLAPASCRACADLAAGGAIRHRRETPSGPVIEALCFTREGFVLTNCNLALFRRLKRCGLIASQGGEPYRITRDGLAAVRAQFDNR